MRIFTDINLSKEVKSYRGMTGIASLHFSFLACAVFGQQPTEGKVKDDHRVAQRRHSLRLL
jgi:hypothetical protein